MRLIRRSRSKNRRQETLSKTFKDSIIKSKLKEEKPFEPDYSFKVLLIGHNSSGKINYVERFGNSWFKANTKLTIGISFEIKEINIGNDSIKLQIWDLASEERWKKLIPYYCRGALGAILMFETSNSKTLWMLSKWVQIIRDNTNNIPIILMGNNDNLDEPRQVSKDEGIEFVSSNQLEAYFECNVLTSENLKNAFESLIKMIISRFETK
jgi:small GTP-binding protein